MSRSSETFRSTLLHPVCRVAVVAMLCLAMALGISVPLHGSAYADVRKADIVADETVEDRGLSVSEAPSVSADFAALASSDGTVYFSRAGNEKSQIASITKVMTAIVAIDCASDDLEITVSENAAEIGESSAGLQEGDVMDLPDGNCRSRLLRETMRRSRLRKQWAPRSKAGAPTLWAHSSIR